MNFRRTVLMAASVAGLCISIASAQQLQTNITRMGLKGDAAAVWAVIDREWGAAAAAAARI